MIRTIASVIVSIAGFSLAGKDMSGAQAGLILAFSLAASQGRLFVGTSGHY